VRTKDIRETNPLTQGNWAVLDVPSHEIEKSKRWFKEYDDEPYSWIGAAGTKLKFLQPLALLLRGFFCNWACLAAFFPALIRIRRQKVASD
jgi:hypothetical protein